MSSKQGNNYEQSEIGSADSVKSSVCNHSAEARCTRLHTDRNARIRFKIARFAGSFAVAAQSMVRTTAGIVQMVQAVHQCAKSAVEKMLQNVAHQRAQMLQRVEKVVLNATEFSTFNPFVAGSNPARPTTLTKRPPRLRWAFLFVSQQCAQALPAGQPASRAL